MSPVWRDTQHAPVLPAMWPSPSRVAFGVQRSAFSVQRSAFSVQRSVSGVRNPTVRRRAGPSGTRPPVL